MADLPNSGSSAPEIVLNDLTVTPPNSGLRTDFIGNSAIFSPEFNSSRVNEIILSQGDEVLVTEATVQNFGSRHDSAPLPASSSSGVTSASATAHPARAGIPTVGAGLPNMADFSVFFKHMAQAMTESQLGINRYVPEDPEPDRTSSIDNNATHDRLDDFVEATAVPSGPEIVDDLLADMSSFFDNEEKTGPKVSEDLAQAVSSGFRSKVPKEKKKALLDKYLRPENCPTIKTPRVNKSIWTSMSRSARDTDLASQICQNNVCAMTYPLIQLMDILNSAKKSRRPVFDGELQQCLQLTMDSFKLSQLLFTDITFRRREAIQPQLQTAYKELCSDDTPVTDQLFGDDLEKRVKDLTDARNITNKLGQNKNSSSRPRFQTHRHQQRPQFQPRYQPYPQQRGHFQSRPAYNQFKKGGAANSQGRNQTSAPFLGGKNSNARPPNTHKAAKRTN